MWTAIASRKPGEQVACCNECATRYRLKDVPSKRYWCEKEDTVAAALHGLTIREEQDPVRRHVRPTLAAFRQREARRARL